MVVKGSCICRRSIMNQWHNHIDVTERCCLIRFDWLFSLILNLMFESCVCFLFLLFLVKKKWKQQRLDSGRLNMHFTLSYSWYLLSYHSCYVWDYSDAVWLSWWQHILSYLVGDSYTDDIVTWCSSDYYSLTIALEASLLSS